MNANDHQAEATLARKLKVPHLTGLRQILIQRFDEGELRTLCDDLDVDYDSLPTIGKANKARELVSYLERRDRIPDLVELGKAQRPDIPWEDALEATRTANVAQAEFVNREDELPRLKVDRLRVSRSPYTLVNAPAGYGKSYLLRRLIDVIESDEALCQKWCVRYADFGLVAEKSKPQIAFMVRSITGSDQDEADISTNVVADAVVNQLSTPLPEGRRAVLLIFDAVGRLKQKARRWLYALLNDLRAYTRVGQQEIITVRTIIAARDVDAFWDGYVEAFSWLPVPQRITLSPFGELTIRELILKHAQAARIAERLDDQTVTQMACEVEYLGGGHPKVIHGLIDQLMGRSFAIGPVSVYFARDRERLVQTVLFPVADDLLASLEAEIVNAVQTLSVFRRVNANTVQALVVAGVLPSETNEIELLGDMQRAHLLIGPGIREPFYRDPLMRRILALNMAYEAEDQFRRLNEIALELYGGWIHNLGQGLPDTPLKATQRLLSIVEWLFHALCEENMEQNKLCSGLQGHIDALSAIDNPSLSVADLITDEIRRDTEVCYLLRHRLGDDGVSVACGWMQATPIGTSHQSAESDL